MTELKYTFKTDVLFKMLFVQYPLLLQKLVAELLSIKLEEIQEFKVENPDIPPDKLGEKFCRLDINMTVNGQVVDLEIQVEDEKDFPERTLYYWARDYSSSLKKNMKYIDLPRVIVVSIVNFPLFKDYKGFHSEFAPLEVSRHTLLSDRMKLHYFELTKIPEEISKDEKLLLWLALFRANTEEELEKLEKLEVPEMSEAINAYRTITVTPEFKEAIRLSERAKHNEAAALYNAEQRGEKRGENKKAIETAIKAINKNYPIEDIIELTGLSFEEIIALKKSNKEFGNN